MDWYQDTLPALQESTRVSVVLSCDFVSLVNMEHMRFDTSYELHIPLFDCLCKPNALTYVTIMSLMENLPGIVVGHPLDSIKVLLQTNGGGSTSSSTSGVQRTATTAITSAGQIRAYSSSNAASIQSSSTKANICQTATSIPSSQGSIIGKRSLRALYSGVTGPILTTGIFQSLNFAIYDSVRRVLYQQQIQSDGDDTTISRRPDDYLHYDNLFNTFIASFTAGASTSVLTSPMIIVKTKQQIKVWGFRRSIKETYLSGLSKQPNVLNGIRNFYTGFGFHFFCDSIGRGVYMYSYELLKRQLAQAKLYNNKSATNEQQEQQQIPNRVSTANLSIPERMICAASSGMICWAFIFPADVIRSKLYAKSLNAQVQPTTMDGIYLARQMVKEQGIQSLYRGGVTVLRAGPVAAAVLPVYDSVLEWLSS